MSQPQHLVDERARAGTEEQQARSGRSAGVLARSVFVRSVFVEIN
jgi:hypothetical protein